MRRAKPSEWKGGGGKGRGEVTRPEGGNCDVMDGKVREVRAVMPRCPRISFSNQILASLPYQSVTADI
jgi:hypothetical protein